MVLDEIRWGKTLASGRFEGEAWRQMAERDEDDWPTAALALTLGERHNPAVWSQNNDSSMPNLAVLTTVVLWTSWQAAVRWGAC